MEKMLQFAWANRLWRPAALTTVEELEVEVLDPGRLNEDAGPDFFNAVVRIDGQTWAGNVEIHVRASDWYRHGHDADPAYDTVILHVVAVDDRPVYRSDGSLIPQVLLVLNPQAQTRSQQLIEQAETLLPCAGTIRALPQILVTDWLTALGMERLWRRSERIRQILERCQGDWQQAAFVALARGLGFGLNAEPLEVMAQNLPFHCLNKHRDDTLQVEALLFGSAGLIPDPLIEEDPYIERLRQEWQFLSRKFGLRRQSLVWKHARTRPWNFPERRIATLAQIVHRGFDYAQHLDDQLSLPQLEQLFDVQLDGYWSTHFSFGTLPGAQHQRALSPEALRTLIVNVALPLQHARAMQLADLQAMDRAPEMLQALPPEDNAIVRQFERVAGIKSTSAFTSQALVELRKEYCQRRKCIYCRFGLHMLAKAIRP